MKRIHEFIMDEETLVEKKETSKNEAGAEIIVISKVREKVPRKLFLRKPNQALSDAADLFYGEKFAEAFRRGLLPRALVEKKLNDDGIFTKEEGERLDKLTQELFSFQEQYQKALLKPEAERTDAEKSEIEGLKSKLAIKNREYAEIEGRRAGPLSNTCEIYARNQAIVWWTFFLSYREVDGKAEPFFKGEIYADKLKSYDEISDREDPFEVEAAQRFILYSMFWLLNRGRVLGKVEFEALDTQREPLNEGSQDIGTMG